MILEDMHVVLLFNLVYSLLRLLIDNGADVNLLDGVSISIQHLIISRIITSFAYSSGRE